MTGKGLRAYNDAPTKEELRKGRKVRWIERKSSLLMIKICRMISSRFRGKQGKVMCYRVEFLE